MKSTFSEFSLGAPSFPRSLRKGWETAKKESTSRVAPHHRNGLKLPNGFTLMELLIVISIILILMLVAIPTAGKIRKQANELSAQKSLQTIQEAESMYESTYPTSGFACSLQALGGEPTGAPSATAAGDINGELATGIKSGYIFNIINCTKVTVNNGDRITSYTATAVPATPGKTGDRGFCLDSGGAMKADPAGGTNCTQLVQ